MKKIAFIINSESYVRNYISNDVLKNLINTFEVCFIVRADVNSSELNRKYNVITYDCDVIGGINKRRTFNTLMHKHKHKSKSFKYRIQRSSVLQKGFGRHKFVFALKFFSELNRIIDQIKNRILYSLIAMLPEKAIHQLFGSNSVNISLMENVKLVMPDIVVLPSSAYASEDIDFSSIAESISVPSLLLIDNWDNLSSKSILWRLPSHVGVWGEQSKEHAVQIQKFNPANVHLIGTARFDAYFKYRDTELQSHFDFPYVLFVGTSLYFDEYRVLEILDDLISQNSDVYGDLKIVYRPHPWRQNPKSQPMQLKSVILDPQLKNSYNNAQNNDTFQPSLEYYPSLLSNALFVIGGMTSMLIEAQIFWKKYLALVHEEENSITCPRKVYNNYEHFVGIDSLKYVQLCNALDELSNQFLSIFQDHKVKDKALCDEQRKFYLFSDEKDYGDRLCSLVSQLIEK
jgi:hypothetical protein